MITSQTTDAHPGLVASRPLMPWLRKPTAIAIAALLLLAASVPVIALSGWFPLDVPMLFQVCENLSGNWLGLFNPHNGIGRLFPMYWVWNCAQYRFFGSAVTPYYAMQAVLLAATALMLCRMLGKLAGGRWSALLLALLYASIPLAENLTTLGKNEPTADFLIVAGVLLFDFGRRHARRATTVAACAGAGLLFLLAVWSKETSIVLFVVPVAGVVLVAALRRHAAAAALARDRAAYLLLLIALAGGFALSRLPYLLFRDGDKGAAYTDYAITPALVMGNVRFYLEQQWDVVFFGLVAAVLLLVLLKRVSRADSARQSIDAGQVVLVASVAAMAWSYWLGMQLWRWPMNYYMLLPDALFKFCAVYAAVTLHRAGGLGRLKAWALGAASALALLWGTVGALYIGTTQVAFSRIYTDAMRKLPKDLNAERRLVLDPYPSWAEHVSATQLLVRNQLHLPVQVTGLGNLLDSTPPSPQILQLMNMTQADLERARRAPLREGDLLLTFTGQKLAHWVVRGVAPYHLLQSAVATDSRYELQPLAEERITTPAVLARAGWVLPRVAETFVGYKLSRVIEKQTRFEWSGRYADGWIGEHAKLTVMPAWRDPIVFKLRMESFTVPATIRILRDGRLFREVPVTTNEAIMVDAGPAPQTATTFEFESSRSFVPKEAGINDDPRRLAALVSLTQGTPRP